LAEILVPTNFNADGANKYQHCRRIRCAHVRGREIQKGEALIDLA
jgi:hypothetical protein